MDEDSFTRLFSVRIICLTLTFAFIVVLYAFNTFAKENTEHQASNEQVKENKNAHVVVSPALGKKSEPFHPIILRAASRHEVDPSLIKAIIMVESRYDPHAISRRGAKGLMQLMPRTARALGVDDAFNAEQNVNGGVKYLKQLLDEFNDNIKLAVAAYNAGSSKVRQHRGIPPIKGTQYYVKKVFEYYQYYKNEAFRKTKNV